MAVTKVSINRILKGTTAELLAWPNEAKRREAFLNTDTGELVMGPGLYSAVTRNAGAAVVNTVVRAATTANITIATALNNGDTLDGLTLATGDLVLVKDQSAPAENGIYVVGASPARSTAYDTYNEHVNKLIKVTSGTANAGKHFRCSADTGGTLNTTAITFTVVTLNDLNAHSIDQLAGLTTKTPVLADILMIEDSVTGQLKRITLTELQTLINV